MPDQNAPMPTRRLLSSEGEYQQGIDEVLFRACHRLLIFDRVLYPRWDQPRRADVLRRLCLANPRNTVCIALHDPESMLRDTPRLFSMLQTCAHAISIHRTQGEALRAQDPLVVADGRHFVRRFHLDGSRGVVVTDDPERTQPLLQRFEQIWAACSPGLSGTTMGL